MDAKRIAAEGLEVAVVGSELLPLRRAADLGGQGQSRVILADGRVVGAGVGPGVGAAVLVARAGDDEGFTSGLSTRAEGGVGHGFCFAG